MAALKRYGAIVGKRPEYTLPLTEVERASSAQLRTAQEQVVEANQGVNLPPIPERQNIPPGNNGAAESAARPADDQATARPEQAGGLEVQAPLPPLPVAAANIGNAQGEAANANGEANDNIVQPGYFVHNDIMDEGVRLVAKFQHGTVTEDQIAGPGTRSGRGKVKVLLFARCPLGGHFATGASDGTCRIWEDVDDQDVETLDSRLSKNSYEWIGDTGTSSKERRRSGTCDLSYSLCARSGNAQTLLL